MVDGNMTLQDRNVARTAAHNVASVATLQDHDAVRATARDVTSVSSS
jgi:hypothetical protein